MYYFGVYYQGRHSGLTKQERFLANHDDIVKLVRPLDGTTIFCSWDAKAIGGVYDRVKRIYDGSSMAAAKTLYFFVPDLFVILDRKQVWNEWRAECPFLPKSISRVSGADCVAILQHVRKKIMVAIREGIPFTLGHSLSSAVKTVDALMRIDLPASVDVNIQ